MQSNCRRNKFDIVLDRNLLSTWPVNTMSMGAVCVETYPSGLSSLCFQFQTRRIVHPDILAPHWYWSKIRLKSIQPLIRGYIAKSLR